MEDTIGLPNTCHFCDHFKVRINGDGLYELVLILLNRRVEINHPKWVKNSFLRI